MLTQIDLGVVIRRQIPVLLDKVAPVPIFVTGKCENEWIHIQSNPFLDSPAIRLIKTLCREFNETFQHMFTNTVSKSLVIRMNLYHSGQPDQIEQQAVSLMETLGRNTFE
jgi:hypothetical protein